MSTVKESFIRELNAAQVKDFGDSLENVLRARHGLRILKSFRNKAVLETVEAHLREFLLAPNFGDSFNVLIGSVEARATVVDDILLIRADFLGAEVTRGFDLTDIE